MTTATVVTGKLNRRIQIQQQSTVQADDGSPSASWAVIYTCWAGIDVQRSQLLYSTAEFVSKITHRITLRWPPNVLILPNMRIVYTEPKTSVVHTYNIESLLNQDQENVSLVALCYELNAEE